MLQSVLLVVGVANANGKPAVQSPVTVAPIEPAWPSPLPAFPSSWFGANMKSFEFENPAELAELKKYKQVFASWPEKVLASNFSNATAIAVEEVTRMKASNLNKMI